MLDYLKYWFGNKNALNTGVTGDRIALQKNGNYQMNYNPFKLKNTSGLPSMVKGAEYDKKGKPIIPEDKNYMSLILIAVGVYLFVEILD